MTEKITPRLLTETETAAYLGQPVAQFKRQTAKLEIIGMPPLLPELKRRDRCAIDAWLDQLGGLTGRHFGDQRYQSRPFVHPFNRCSPAFPPPDQANRPTGYSVNQAMDDYLDAFKGSKTSLRNTLYHVNAYIKPRFGHLAVPDLKAKDIRTWMKEISETPRRIRTGFGKPPRFSTEPMDDEARRKRRSSANRCLAVLRAGLNLAYRDGKAPSDNAWRRVQAYPGVSVGPGGYLTVDQCQALTNHCPSDFKKLVQAALLTGARFGELAQLTKKDYDKDSGTIFIAKTKAGRSRYVVLTDEGRSLFDKLGSSGEPDMPLFLRRDGKPWYPTDPYPRLETACQLAEISPRVTFHMLRHTYASLAVMNGTPIPVVSKNLGHATTEPCEKYYAHLAPSYVTKKLREGMPRLGIIDQENV